MPPFLNNFRGLRLSLSEVSLNGSIPENGRGLVALHVEQPEMFVGMAQMFLPDLAGLVLTPGDPPVQVPQTVMPTPDIVAFAALSSDAIGLSFGEGEQNKLTAFLAEEAVESGTFMSTNYDMAAYMDYVGKMERLSSGVEDHRKPLEVGSPHWITDIARSGEETLKSFVDRNQASFRFTEEGLIIDSRLTFK